MYETMLIVSPQGYARLCAGMRRYARLVLVVMNASALQLEPEALLQ
jgi:hypothetical protein